MSEVDKINSNYNYSYKHIKKAISEGSGGKLYYKTFSLYDNANDSVLVLRFLTNDSNFSPLNEPNNHIFYNFVSGYYYDEDDNYFDCFYVSSKGNNQLYYILEGSTFKTTTFVLQSSQTIELL